MGLRVQKFGGTSVSDAERVHRAAKRAIGAKLAGHSVVVVVSARGKTTDELEQMAYEITDNPSKREMDQLLSTGEQISISLMAMAIQSAGHEAVSFTGGQVGLITDNAHTKARIQRIDAERITSQLDAGKIVIVAGFQGVDENANITTLGRGGSDTTAVALAAMLRADRCDIFTDVPGVFTADPRIVPAARKLAQISYDEMLELASLGAGVMHSRAVEFGKKYNVLIHVRSSATDEAGTEICQEVDGMEEIVVSGVSLKKNVAQITMDHVPDTPGIAADIFARIAQANVIVDDIIQTEHGTGCATLSFTVDTADLKTAQEVVAKPAANWEGCEISCETELAKVSAVGVGMRSHTGVAHTMFRALAETKININAITTSEIRISCLISREQGPEAMRVVHQAFGLESKQGRNSL